METGKIRTYARKIKGLKIHFAKAGKGPPLVFIHGWTNNWEGWIPVVKYLKEAFTLYLVDMPGFGDSGDLQAYSVEICSDYLASFIRFIPQKISAVVGLSMGSFLAVDLAKRYPALVSRAILAGPVIKDGKARIWPKAVNMTLRGINQSSRAKSVLKKIIETRTVAYFSAKYMNMYRFDKNIVDKYGMTGKKKLRRDAYVQMGISASKYNLREEIIRSSIPVLIIIGKEDKYTSPDYLLGKILPHNPNLTVDVIDVAGHSVSWDQPERTAQSIISYLHRQPLGL